MEDSIMFTNIHSSNKRNKNECKWIVEVDYIVVILQ
jgi:hypothetical protein